MTTIDFIIMLLIFTLTTIVLGLMCWVARKDAFFWKECYKREAELHRKNLEYCQKVIFRLSELERFEQSMRAPVAPSDLITRL